MSSMTALHRRINALLVQVDRHDDTDCNALDIINRSLSKSLALINDDGTLPADFEQRVEQIEQEITPVERIIIDRFERRYPPGAEVAALLADLESGSVNTMS